ncbi:hypothetical protein FGG08_003768 [Glutinoglossum americanum]|uniref:NADP-dependent oxidoreductase domain-containing protein n=1 Tax=Glutinoglossum americanum TaxID=1670608 RepID=A0A9P8I3Q6_9PEZI|nr:hypothetical protein FGG08_003768 [Glutinoglossum americanum]
MPKFTLTDLVALPNTLVKMPRLGFGVYQSPPETCIQSVLTALKAGYRHIDTAQYYTNEREVGEAVRRSGIPREEIFVTTKIIRTTENPDRAYETAVKSVEKIGLGYVDLFLIHTPGRGKGARKVTWGALERLVEEGKARSIGVSNYGIGHIEEMKGYAKIWPPHVNQIELHPWCQQREITTYCRTNNIAIQAYCPLVRNYKAKDPTLLALADKYERTTAQILIRYCLQKEWVPLPKSDNEGRIYENANIFGFEIEDGDMGVLDGLDQGARGAVVMAVINR